MEIRENVLTESNIRDLVKLLDEEMDGVARKQRERLQTIDEELEDVKRRLGRIWQVIETTDIEMADASERIREGFAPKVPLVPKVRILFLKSGGLSNGSRLYVGALDRVHRAILPWDSTPRAAIFCIANRL